jgi:thiamine pyrophosphate-dependent acetolactate synthase large subunit-like protein
MTSADQLLVELVAQSQNIFELAARGEWEEVVKLESDRRELMQACFAPDASFDDPQVAAQQIQEIMDIDARVMELGGKARTEAAQALSDIQRGRQAVSAYDKVGR